MQGLGEALGAGAQNATIYFANISLGNGTVVALPVLQAGFGPSWVSLSASAASEGRPLALAQADPLDGCTPLNASAVVEGAVALMQRGTCSFAAKAIAAAEAGAVAALVYDDRLAGYFWMAADPDEGASVAIPVGGIPLRQGVWLQQALGRGAAVVMTLAPLALPIDTTQNLAVYSSKASTCVGRLDRVLWGEPCCRLPYGMHRTMGRVLPSTVLPGPVAGPHD